MRSYWDSWKFDVEEVAPFIYVVGMESKHKFDEQTDDLCGFPTAVTVNDIHDTNPVML